MAKIKKSQLVTFLKWSLSSQIASLVDMATSSLLFAFVIPNKAYSKMIGQIVGAIVNCSINYKWTFGRGEKSGYTATAIKYAMVWVGSLTLNTAGTTLMSNALDGASFIQAYNITPNGTFLIAQIVVSLLVSIFWNLILQRYFVYRQLNFTERLSKFFKGKAK